MTQATPLRLSGLPRTTAKALTRDRVGVALTWVARFALAGVFAWAAVPKILDPAAFALAIERYRLLPESMISPAAILLPWVELVAAMGLFAPRAWRRAAGSLLAALLVVFAAAIASAWLRGLDVSCGCFSVAVATSDASVTRVGPLLLLRNAGLLALVFLATRDANRPRKESA